MGVFTATKYRLYSFDDFCRIIPEGQKADLIDGVIYMASPDNIDHYRLNKWLFWLADSYLDAVNLGGELFGYRIAFRLDDGSGPEPDLAYVSKRRLQLVRRGFIDGAPDWALEIISPDSVDRDYYKKLKQFEEARVREYWIVDPLEEKMTCFVLTSKGKLKKVPIKQDRIESKVIAGFWVRPSWLWQSPLPNKQKTLVEILGAKQ